MNQGNVFGPNAGQGGAPLNININVADLAEVVCPGVIRRSSELCGSTIFLQGFELRVAPAIMTGAKENTVLQVPVYICTVCKTIISSLGPSPAIEAAARRSIKGLK